MGEENSCNLPSGKINFPVSIEVDWHEVHKPIVAWKILGVCGVYIVREEGRWHL
ncbi:hypothetical protein HanPSC8_Chr15g0655391 [Helianthus annuus]|nr:hypothetical protein HanPSC8_Chr15g0655391 [Helianthus annuus]